MNLLLTVEKGRRSQPAAEQGAFDFEEEDHPRAPAGGQGSYRGGEFVPRGQETHPAVVVTEHPGAPPALLLPAAAHVQEPEKKPEARGGRMSYAETVKANLEHMGTPASEWSAVGVTGTQETEDDQGKTRAMPVFSFPAGYGEAPSLIQGENCCHLCGTNIKNYYWLQNDAKKWTMPVGSECVTRFGEGKSGEKLSKEAKWGENRTFLRQTLATRAALRARYTRVAYGGYGNRVVTYTNPAASRINVELRKLTEDMDADRRYGDGYWTSDASVTRWVNKNGARVRELLEQASALLPQELAALVLAKGRAKGAPVGQGSFSFDEEAHPRAEVGATGQYRGGEFVPRERSTAYQMGQAAFQRGVMVIPMMDPQFMAMLRGAAVGESAPHMTEWTKGWHHANLAEQEKAEVTPEPPVKPSTQIPEDADLPPEPGEARDTEIRKRIDWLKANVARNDVRLRRGNIASEVHAETRARQEARLKRLEELLPPEEGPKLLLKPDPDRTPWLLSATGYNSAKGVHTPWIAEISPMQYGMFSERQKKAYDKKREQEWGASLASKQEWAAKVMAAFDAGAITRQTPGLSRDAEETIVYTQMAREEAAKERAREQKTRENAITSIDQVSVGDRVFDIMSHRYGTILKKFKVGVRIQLDNPPGGYQIGPHTVNVGALQWKEYNDLHKAKRSVPAGQGTFTFDEEEHPRAPAGAAGQWRGGEFVPRAAVPHPAVPVEEHPGHGPALVLPVEPLTVEPPPGILRQEGPDMTAVKQKQKRQDVHRPAEMVPGEYEYLANSYPIEVEDASGPHTEIDWDGTPEWDDMGSPREGTAAHSRPGQCDHCGAHHTYQVMLRHQPTGDLVSVGHDCYANRFNRPDWKNQVASQARRAELAAQRAANVKAALAALTEPERAAYEWALSEEQPNGLARDIAQQVSEHGPLSEKQKALLVKLQAEERLKAEERARLELTLTPVPEGPQQVSGTAAGFKTVETQFGATIKMIVQDDRGFKVFGTLPAKAGNLQKGDRIEFEAELQRSKDDKFFGFYSRPKKIKVAETRKGELEEVEWGVWRKPQEAGHFPELLERHSARHLAEARVVELGKDRHEFWSFPKGAVLSE